MKKGIAILIFIGFVFIANAQLLQSHNYYKQKRWLDSLRSNRKLSIVTINPNSKVEYNMPVLLLKNEGEEISANEKGEIYKMKIDNMLCLKPYETDATIPNAEEKKQSFTLPLADKKP